MVASILVELNNEVFQEIRKIIFEFFNIGLLAKKYSFTEKEVFAFLVNIVPVGAVVQLLVGAGFVWLSYRLFERMTVVRRKLL